MFALSLTLLFTTTVDLYPFNGVHHYTKKERISEALRNGLILLVPIALVFWANRWAVAIASLVMFLFAVGMGLTWLVPYFTGKEAYKLPNNETWPEMYQRIFADTITILPRRKNPKMPTLNLEHTILFTPVVASGIALGLYTAHL